MERAINSAMGIYQSSQEDWITIDAPLIDYSKVAIARLAIDANVVIEQTWSCYIGESEQCGKCDSCQIRNAALKEVLGNERFEDSRNLR
jgi:7-cyano-7-deazaguanine synthase in queuosine biosynthesis